MEASRIDELVLGILARIAPEADLATLAPEVRFRDQLTFDSIDCLNLVKGIEEALAIRIPEEDCPRLASLAGCRRYLADR